MLLGDFNFTVMFSTNFNFTDYEYYIHFIEIYLSNY